MFAEEEKIFPSLLIIVVCVLEPTENPPGLLNVVSAMFISS
jgi:hypothetical protein